MNQLLNELNAIDSNIDSMDSLLNQLDALKLTKSKKLRDINKILKKYGIDPSNIVQGKRNRKPAVKSPAKSPAKARRAAKSPAAKARRKAAAAAKSPKARRAVKSPAKAKARRAVKSPAKAKARRNRKAAAAAAAPVKQEWHSIGTEWEWITFFRSVRRELGSHIVVKCIAPDTIQIVINSPRINEVIYHLQSNVPANQIIIQPDYIINIYNPYWDWFTFINQHARELYNVSIVGMPHLYPILYF